MEKPVCILIIVIALTKTINHKQFKQFINNSFDLIQTHTHTNIWRYTDFHSSYSYSKYHSLVKKYKIHFDEVNKSNWKIQIFSTHWIYIYFCQHFKITFMRRLKSSMDKTGCISFMCAVSFYTLNGWS